MQTANATTMKHLMTQQRLTIWMLQNKIAQHEKRLDKGLDIRFETLLERIEYGLQRLPRNGSQPHGKANKSYSRAARLPSVSCAAWL